MKYCIIFIGFMIILISGVSLFGDQLIELSSPKTKAPIATPTTPAPAPLAPPPSPTPQASTSSQPVQPSQTADLNPYKYNISPDAGGTFESPTVHIDIPSAPKPYQVITPTITYPPTDNCHIALGC